MLRPVRNLGLLVLVLAFFAGALRAAPATPPVTPDASPEARALLALLYSISGNNILTGQHNFPAVGSRNSAFAARYTGKSPVVFSSDFGHARAGDSDSYLARPDIVQEAIRQHRLGALVTLCWHAVPPTADEPVTFRSLPGADPANLASVQGQLLDSQFQELLTPGTPLYQHWCAQVDAVAVFLKQLEAAHVPVLWRPYHEMNGAWFWWGGRTGPYSTSALYRQLFDRLVRHHHLTNLVWVWSMDRMSKPNMEHEKFFPGIEYVDVLGLDVYQNDFAQSYYDSLVALSQGKPLALAEVGNPPALEILDRQPRWTFYVTWAGMVRNTPRKQYARLASDPRILGLEDSAYATAVTPYRVACGLPPMQFTPKPANFSGEWILDEDRSALGTRGAGFLPARMAVIHQDNALTIRSTRIVEYAEDETTEEHLPLDGTEAKSEFMHSPRVTTARLSPDATTLTADSTILTNWGPPGSKFIIHETWVLGDGGRTLTIQRHSETFMGPQDVTLVFVKR